MRPHPGPRDLSAEVARWLRRLGFQVLEQPAPGLSLVRATWTDLTGEQFSVQYVHYHPPEGPVSWAACQMRRRAPGRPGRVCFANTQVRRLREVRLLVLGNDRFAQARQRLLAASSTPSPSLP